MGILLSFYGPAILITGMVALVRGRLGLLRIRSRLHAALVVSAGLASIVAGRALASESRVTAAWFTTLMLLGIVSFVVGLYALYKGGWERIAIRSRVQASLVLGLGLALVCASGVVAGVHGRRIAAVLAPFERHLAAHDFAAAAHDLRTARAFDKDDWEFAEAQRRLDREVIRDRQYRKGVALLRRNDFDQAVAVLAPLRGYRNARHLAAMARRYLAAKRAIAARQWAAARAQLAPLPPDFASVASLRAQIDKASWHAGGPTPAKGGGPRILPPAAPSTGTASQPPAVHASSPGASAYQRRQYVRRLNERLQSDGAAGTALLEGPDGTTLRVHYASTQRFVSALSLPDSRASLAGLGFRRVVFDGSSGYVVFDIQ